MTFTDIFFELDSIYSNEWFVDASNKFYAHPSNKNKAESFEIEVIDFENNNTLKQNITFKDFVFGIKDDGFDNIHDDLEMNNKLETVGVLPNGYPDNKLIEGEIFVSSVSFYPNPTLNIWKKKLINKIDRSINLITSLNEKELFVDALRNLIKTHKNELNTINKEPRSSILSELLNQVYYFLTEISSEITELNDFIESYDKSKDKLCIELNQQDLANLLKLLIDKKILNNQVQTDEKIMEWFKNHIYVRKEKKVRDFVVPASLYNTYRNRRNPKDLTDWFNTLDIQP